MKSTRRTFLAAAAGAASIRRGRPAQARITAISLSTIQGNFHKFVAMNSQDNEPKGMGYTNVLVRIATDAGVEGVGVMGYTPPDSAFLRDVRSLLGADPEAAYEFRDGRVWGRSATFSGLLTRYKHLDGPLFDLIGKLRGVPCWQLLGESVRETVEVYDGTLYFSDLWFQDRGVQAVVDEALEATGNGYVGVKLKIGRGHKWMRSEEGLDRDVEIIRAVRSAIGFDRKLLVDANNAYANDPSLAWRLLERTKDQRVDWLEEAFPDDVALYQELRAKMARHGIRTPIADGESIREVEEFRPFLEPHPVIDVMQMDIRTGGLLDCRTMADIGMPAGVRAVPHNWGAQVGLFMSLHLAKTHKNISGAEDDRSNCPALTASGYEFRDGAYTVSDEPGLGIAVNESFYEAPEFPGETVIR